MFKRNRTAMLDAKACRRRALMFLIAYVIVAALMIFGAIYVLAYWHHLTALPDANYGPLLIMICALVAGYVILMLLTNRMVDWVLRFGELRDAKAQ